MKTQDKIKKLCKEKYNMPISVYEKKLGYANGSLTKGGNMYSSRKVPENSGFALQPCYICHLMSAIKKEPTSIKR